MEIAASGSHNMLSRGISDQHVKAKDLDKEPELDMINPFTVYATKNGLKIRIKIKIDERMSQTIRL